MSFPNAGIADPFDSLLVQTCQILMKKSFGSSSDDGYGQPPQSFITLVSNQPCRKSTFRRGGTEYKTGKEFATQEFVFFMRPPTLSAPSPTTNLTTHHWIRLNSDLDPDDPNYDQSLFNVTAVKDPSGVGHHLEVTAIQVQP